ncbi:DNA polymerase III subunit beta [Feifania hominis]|uniref:Beta sliding clamp n=1 Tax=Feifania hominis TaxID=2763660 RepID=A0A926DES3_9FIRM|nr:DNA polymerase III subunit beta [Feifania hominis]MBC8536469.1 DNA polymerase III subunit beta [Feifania hominis]
MYLSCNREDLLEAVLCASRAVSSKTSLAALEGVLLEYGRELKVTGYNLEIGIESVIPCECDGTGSVVINAHTFSEILRKMDHDVVTIEVDDKLKITIKCGMSEFTILGTSSGEFPEMPKVDRERSLKLPQNLLKNMIRQTVYAVSTNENKPIHTGCLFDVASDSLKVVGVDGYRLALREEKIDTETGEAFSFVVPGRALSEIVKLMDDTDNPISISLSRKHIIFELENKQLVSRLLEGEFLNYKAAIPANATIKIRAKVKNFVDSIERASLLISERQRSPIRIQFHDDTVVMNCSTPLGRVYDEFAAASSGGSLEMGFNNKYLLDAFRYCEQEEVMVELTSPLAPLVLRPVEGEGFIFLVLPVRLKSDEN